MLFTFMGGLGHFLPLVPFATAVQEAGHVVAVQGARSLTGAIERAGFTALTVESAPIREPERLPLRALDQDRENAEFVERFARNGSRVRAEWLEPIVRDWRPDVLICDETDFGAMVVAEKLGVPRAIVRVMAAAALVRRELVADALGELRALHGLPPDPGLAMLDGSLVLVPFPPSLPDPALPLPATARAFRPAGLDDEADALAEGVLPAGDAPLVYFTLGTVYNMESGDLFARVIAGLWELPVRLVVTVGEHIDPAELGPQPDHVRVHRFIAQAGLLPHCALVVAHGGSGSVIGALAQGLPMVLSPMGADQLQNAARCVALGVAETLDAFTVTSDVARDTVATVLADARYRAAAERLRDEIANLPPAADAVPLLERLAR